jgi:hypothetical protein
MGGFPQVSMRGVFLVSAGLALHFAGILLLAGWLYAAGRSHASNDDSWCNVNSCTYRSAFWTVWLTIHSSPISSTRPTAANERAALMVAAVLGYVLLPLASLAGIASLMDKRALFVSGTKLAGALYAGSLVACIILASILTAIRDPGLLTVCGVENCDWGTSFYLVFMVWHARAFGEQVAIEGGARATF